MSRIIRYRRIILLVLIAIFCVNATAFAAITIIEEDRSLLATYISNNYDSAEVQKLLVQEADKNSIAHTVINGKINGVPVSFLIRDDKQAEVDNILKKYKVELSNTADKEQQDQIMADVSDIVHGLDLTPDTAGAKVIVEPLVPYARIFMGLLVLATVIIIPAITALDILYINSDGFHKKVDDAVMSGGTDGGIGKAFAKQDKRTGGYRPRFISREAIYACEESAKTGKNAVKIYFGKRIWYHISTVAVLYILLTGNIDIITNLFLKLIAGFLTILNRLSK